MSIPLSASTTMLLFFLTYASRFFLSLPYLFLLHFLAPGGSSLVRPWSCSHHTFKVSVSGVRNSRAHINLVLKAGSTIDDLVSLLRRRHVLPTSRSLRHRFRVASSGAVLRGVDVLPFSSAVLNLQLDTFLYPPCTWHQWGLRLVESFALCPFQAASTRLTYRTLLSHATSILPFRPKVCPLDPSGQVFVMVAAGQTAALTFPDFHQATVEDVFHSLAARDYLGHNHLSSYYLSFRSWRSMPLPMKSTFFDLGIRRHSTLILCLRRQGGTNDRLSPTHDNQSIFRLNPSRAAKTNHKAFNLPSRKRAHSESYSDAESSTKDGFSPKRSKTAQKKKQPAVSRTGKENRGLPLQKPSKSEHQLCFDRKQGATPTVAVGPIASTSTSLHPFLSQLVPTITNNSRPSDSTETIETVPSPIINLGHVQPSVVHLDCTIGSTEAGKGQTVPVPKPAEVALKSLPPSRSSVAHTDVENRPVGGKVLVFDTPLPSALRANQRGTTRNEASIASWTPCGEQVITMSLDHPVRIIKDGSAWIYQFNGARCQHAQSPIATSSTSSSDFSPSSQSSETPPALESLGEEHMDNSCVGLMAHSISMCKPVDAFFCRLHKEFIPPSEIKKHIKNRHGKTLPCGGNIVSNFLEHIETLYPAISGAGSRSTPNARRFPISTPISFLPDPALFALCPSTSCSSLFKWDTTEVQSGVVSKGYQLHMKSSQSCRAAQSFQAVEGATNGNSVQHVLRYAQLSGKQMASRWAFYLPEGWKPLSAGTKSPSIPATKENKPSEVADAQAEVEVFQPYITQLGWDKAFPPQHITAFKSLLKMSVTEDACAEEAALAHGLSEVQDFLYGYLEGANQFVENRCSIVRQSITKGSRSKFRQLCPKSISRYRKPLFHLISFLLWFNFQCKSRKKFVNCVDLGLTPDIKRSISKLYGFLIDPSKRENLEAYRDSLAKHVHRLLTASLTGQGPSDRKIHGAFDYVLILAMHLSNGNFRKADCISGYCAMTQYCMRVIVVHSVRMGGLYADYAPLLETDAVGKEEEDADEIGEVEENPLLPPMMLPLPEDHELRSLPGLADGSDPFMIENPLLLDDDDLDFSASIDPWKSIPSSPSDNFINPMDINEDEESMPSPEDNLEDIRPDALFTLLSSHHKWISCTYDLEKGEQPTAFQRMKAVWLIIWPHAITAMTKTHIQWDPEGHVLTYSDPKCPPHQIRLNDLRAFARSLAVEAQKGLEELLPCDIKAADLLNAVDLSTLKDDPACQRSLFEQNKDVFEPLVKRVFESITSRTDIKHKLLTIRVDAENKYRLDRTKKWFSKEQDLLQSILLAYFFSCGIPPRAFQAAELRFTTSRGSKRNIFLMKGFLVFGWPRSKAFSRAVQASLWSLPPSLGKIVMIYLGILRPVALRIAQDAKLDPSPDARHILFANTISVGNRVGSWGSEYLGRFIKARTLESLGLSLGTPRLRQIMSAIFRKHLSGLIDPLSGRTYIQTSHANLQADHTQQTSNLHYGVGIGPSSGLMISDANVDRFIEVSQAWQAILGLVTGSRQILDRLYGVPQYEEGLRAQFAFERVRSLICRRYNLGRDSLRANDVAAAQNLLSSLPFVPCKHKSPTGDEVLWEIASILIFRGGRPGIADAAPLTGYPPLAIIDAVILIMLGIDEWAREEVMEYNLLDLTVIAAMDDTRKLILPKIAMLEEKSPAEWTELGVQIFRCASTAAPSVAVVKPLAVLNIIGIGED